MEGLPPRAEEGPPMTPDVYDFLLNFVIVFGISAALLCAARVADL